MEMKGNHSSVHENIYEISEDVQVASRESTAVKEKTTWLKTGLLVICLVVTIAFASATIALFAKTASNEILQEENFSKLNMITSNHNQTIEKTKSKTTDVEKLTMDSHEKISVLSKKLEKQLAMIEANFNKSFAELREQSKELKLEMEINRDTLWELGGFTASNGFQYKITKTSQNFQDSRDACARMGGHLAYIGVSNEKIHSEILQNIGKGWSLMYIDLTDVEVEGQFRWGDGVLPLTGWTKWLGRQPDNHNGVEDCVQLIEISQLWNDMMCSSIMKALCERRVK